MCRILQMYKTEGQTCTCAPGPLTSRRIGAHTPVPVSSLGWRAQDSTEESKNICQSTKQDGGKAFLKLLSWFIVFCWFLKNFLLPTVEKKVA